MIGRVWLFLALLGLATGQALAVEPCSVSRPCAAVAIEGPDAPVGVGETAEVAVRFLQGPGDAVPGGIDEIAGLGFTLAIPGLELADCADPGDDGLNGSFTLLPNAAGRYRLLVQNLTCSGRPSCLCPDSGEARDQHINLLLVGLPGGSGVQALPNGTLVDIAVRVREDAPATLPLHVFSALDDGEPPLPSGAALLSIGDRLAVDRTVDSEDDTLNVRIADGEIVVASATPTGIATTTATATATATSTQPVAQPTATGTATATSSAGPPTVTATVTPIACIGDCNGSGEITVNELIAGVGIALGSLPLSTCEAFDCAGNGQVGVSCLIAGVNAALSGCP